MMEQSNNPPLSWPGLDLLKCLCVIGMVLTHSIYWTWTHSGQVLFTPEHPYFTLYQPLMFLGFFPLTLPLIAGATLYLRLKPILLTKNWMLTPALVLQGAVVALVGYAMNVLAAGWDALEAWNVLQTVAVSMLLIGALTTQRFGVWPVAVVGLLLLAVSDPLRAWWPPDSRHGLALILLGDPDDWHAWPLVPWFSLMVFGFLLAHFYQRTHGGPVFIGGCVLLGTSLMVSAAMANRLLPVFDPRNVMGPMVMQPPAIAVLGLVGVATLLSAVLTALQGRLRLARYGLVRCFSAGILWIYLIHLIVGVRLSNLLFDEYIQREAMVNAPWSGWHPLVLIGFPSLLLLISWLVGYLVLRGLHETRLRLKLRRVTPAPAA